MDVATVLGLEGKQGYRRDGTHLEWKKSIGSDVEILA